MDLGLIAMKWVSALPRSPELKPHNQMQLLVLTRTSRFFLFHRGYSQHILSLPVRASISREFKL